MDWIQPTHGAVTLLAHVNKVRGKAIPLQAWTSCKGFRRLRLPHFKRVDI
jgi:hypothetical protein